MGISRHATARWEGDLKGGQGRIGTQSGVLNDTRTLVRQALARGAAPAATLRIESGG